MEVPRQSQPSTSCIAQIFAVTAGFAFVIVTVISLVAIPIEAKVFDASVYKRALTSNNVYEQMPALLSAHTITDSDDPGNDARFLTTEDKEAIFAELLPPEQIQILLEDSIDQTVAYYNSTDPDARIRISTADLKARLEGESGKLVMSQIISSWPSCTEVENIMWREVLTSPDTETYQPECCPSSDILDAAIPMLGQDFDAMVAAIPDVIDVTPQYTSPSEDPRPTLMLLRWGIKLSPLISLFLLVVVMILVVRSRKSFFGWFGTLFLGVGMMTFLLASLSGLTIEVMLKTIMNAILSAESVTMTGEEPVIALLNLFRYVLQTAGIQIVVLAGLLGLVGLAMIVAAFVVDGSTPKTDTLYREY
ncbi:MAG: hypothetical protein JXB07_01565 [Anaerolineae bacterium]|nr:hypothetical protein [Anaerolineae bacterium]